MPEQAAAVVTPELPPSRVVVTSENRAEYMAKKLDIAEAKPAPEEKPVEEAKVEEPKVEEKKEEEKPEEPKKHGINERFSDLTKQRKEAEEKAAKAVERAEKAEKEAQELRTKAAPPKVEPETTPAPKRDDFASDQEYEDARIDWRADQRIAERERKEAEAKARVEQENLVVSWKTKVDAMKKEVPDYEDRINAATVQVRNYVRDAIVDSDVGPQILLHLADNPKDAERLKDMTPSRAIKEIGKLEEKFAEKKAAPKEEEKPEAKKVEISKAPAPIAPLKGASAPAGQYFDAKGEFTGTPAQWRELRKAKKI